MHDSAAVRPVRVVRLHALDLLRGLCSIGVAAYHFSLWSELPVGSAGHTILAMFGTYGVSVFFVLSGYSLAHAYEHQFRCGLQADVVKAYFQRRLGRLAPLFAVVLLLSVAGKLLVTGKPVDPYVFLANLTLVFGIVDPAATPIVGGWSIGVEVVFYIVFPLLVLLRRSAVQVLLATLVLAAWMDNSLRMHTTLADGWLLYVHPANQAIFFIAGVYLSLFDGHVRRLGSGPHIVAVALGLVAMMAFVGAGARDELALVTGWRRVLLVATSIALVAALARLSLEGTTARAGSLLGGLSYPLYLIHPLVFFAVGKRLDAAVPTLLFLLLATALVAIAADRWFDAPLQRRVKGLGW